MTSHLNIDYIMMCIYMVYTGMMMMIYQYSIFAILSLCINIFFWYAVLVYSTSIFSNVGYCG
jgi:hypothetical protein